MLNALNELDLPHVIGTSWTFQLSALKDSGHKLYWGEEVRGKDISIHSIYKVDTIRAEHCKPHY